MDIDAYRRARLQELVDREAGGVVAEFARLHPKAPDATRLRQLLNPNYRGGNGFREGAARNLEKALGLPSLYFDLGIESAIAAEHTSARPDKGSTEAKTGLIKEILITGKNSINGDGPKESIQNVTPIGRRSVPVISYVQAGMMSEVVDPFALGDGFEMIDAPPECSCRTFGLRIEGNSMEPRFHDGDTVVIDPALAPRPGDFVVGKNGKEEATFKKYVLRGVDENGDEVFELAPLNEDYPTLNSKRDGLVIIGVCVGRWETLRTY
jgi:SOS-response transcriptional repressor LexA